MSKFTNPLNNIKIASPCSADWNAMLGDERKRYCGDCKLNVYNFSGMSRAEAENLIFNSEGRLCVRFFRRADGTILTKDCPVGWRAIKKRAAKISAAFAALVFGILSGFGLTGFFSRKETPLTGQMSVDSRTMMGAVAYKPTPLTGNIAIKEVDKTAMGEIVVTPRIKRKGLN